MLQIQFLDKNIINALVPAFSMMPDGIVFLYDGRNLSKKYTKNIETAIKKRLEHTTIQFKMVSRFSTAEIEAAIRSCLNENKSESVCIDIAGGPELMTACGFMLSKEYELKIVYTNLAQGCIYDVMQNRELTKVRHITVDDYLLAAGAKQVMRSHSIPKDKEYPAICAVAEYTFAHLQEWHALHKHLSDKYANSDTLDFGVPSELLYNGQTYSSQMILSVLRKYGFIEQRKPERYRFMNARYKEYLTNYGIWLEMYIYIKGQEYFDETYLGFVIDWNNSDAIDTVDNEIDVLAMKNSIPVFISCKMRKPDAMDIYEVAFLADRLGGTDAKGAIATTYDVGKDKELPKGIYQRFKKMNVGYLETDAFKIFTPKELFDMVLQNSK